jgi:hypothetical protein
MAKGLVIQKDYIVKTTTVITLIKLNPGFAKNKDGKNWIQYPFFTTTGLDFDKKKKGHAHGDWPAEHSQISISVAEVELTFGQALNHIYVLVASNNTFPGNNLHPKIQ